MVVFSPKFVWDPKFLLEEKITIVDWLFSSAEHSLYSWLQAHTWSSDTKHSAPTAADSRHTTGNCASVRRYRLGRLCYTVQVVRVRGSLGAASQHVSDLTLLLAVSTHKAYQLTYCNCRHREVCTRIPDIYLHFTSFSVFNFILHALLTDV
jgi:hypothetical protein